VSEIAVTEVTVTVFTVSTIDTFAVVSIVEGADVVLTPQDAIAIVANATNAKTDFFMFTLFLIVNK
jgi:hypothetical protein